MAAASTAAATPAKPVATSAAAKQSEWDGREAENGAHTWEQDLTRSDKGRLLPTLGNVHLILSNHKAWQGVIEQDDFGGRVMKRKAPPFPQGVTGEWTDMDDQRTVLWLSQRYGLDTRTDIVMNAVLLVADTTHFHDVREYLERLKWDGVPRVRSMPSTYLRVADSEYVRLAFMKWMIAAVARVMEPGCKVDNVLILEGKQGHRKSTALKVLAGAPWFTDTPIQIGNKDTYAVLAGKWVIELAELDSLNKADSSAVKSFFATAVDRFRNFYGKRATDVPRQCVFAGSVNFDTYLKDESGNRRYWPLRVGGLVDIDGIVAVREQLWAEAVHLYRSGVVWHVEEHERPLFEIEQAERYEGDVYEDKIAKALEYVPRTTMEEILADILKLDTSKWTLAEQRRIGKALKSLGWVAEKRGQLVNAAQLEQAYGQMVGAFQTELLALSDKIVQELRTLYGVEVDVEWVNEHVYGCLEQLSQYQSDGPRGDSSAGTPAAPARADRDDGMGAQASADECESDGDAWAV